MGADLVYGPRAVRALIARDPLGVRELWLHEARHDALERELRGAAAAHGIAVHAVPRRTLDRLVGGARHQGVVARYRPPAVRGLELEDVLAGSAQPALLLALDGVEDPHNLGACLRSADAAGAQALIVPRRRAVGLTPVARKVACGAAESTPVVTVANLARALERLRDAGVRVIGASPEGERSLYALDLRNPTAFVLGGESRGLRRLTRERCDRLASIPMAGTVESLNVSVAAALCLFEARRQRLLGAPGAHVCAQACDRLS